MMSPKSKYCDARDFSCSQTMHDQTAVYTHGIRHAYTHNACDDFNDGFSFLDYKVDNNNIANSYSV